MDHLAKITGKPIRLAVNLVEATQDTQPFVLFSSVMKSLAIKLSKICNDLRLLSSGPRAGLNSGSRRVSDQLVIKSLATARSAKGPQQPE